jgi:membrane protease YdiL (CAAX protease family)
MSVQTRRRAAALLEVLGIYLTGAFLSDQIVKVLVHWHLISTTNPFDLFTVHASNADLLVASRRLFLALMVLYGSYFVLIVPINWWYRRQGPAAYGLTQAGRPWKTLIHAGVTTAVLTQWPVLLHTLVDAIHPLGAMAPWRQAFFEMSWQRWQFWLLAAIMSYALIPVAEELIFRGYYQRRLAEDWGDGPAIIGTACVFTFAQAVSNRERVQHHDDREPVMSGDRVGSCVCLDAVTDSINDRSCHYQCSDDAALARCAVGRVRYRCFLRVARRGKSCQAGLYKYEGGDVHSASGSAITLCDPGAPNPRYDTDRDRNACGGPSPRSD